MKCQLSSIRIAVGIASEVVFHILYVSAFIHQVAVTVSAVASRQFRSQSLIPVFCRCLLQETQRRFRRRRFWLRQLVGQQPGQPGPLNLKALADARAQAQAWESCCLSIQVPRRLKSVQTRFGQGAQS